MSNTARVIEIFPSLQGEGIYVGRPHLFVRFWNCNMACRYCDTEYRGPYREYPRSELTQAVREQIETNGPFHAVSLTGGEPLLWAAFLAGWLPELKALNQAVYLETNGTLPEALETVLPWVDIVAMDLKPPSATGDRSFWPEHERFLRRSLQAGKEVFVKIIVTNDTHSEEIDQACRLVQSIDRSIPVVLQPVTPWGPIREPAAWERVAKWAKKAGDQLSDVRILPQVHRLLGLP